MSRRSAKHRKPSRFAQARPRPSTRHRKPSPVAAALGRGPVRIAGAVTGAALVVGAVSPAIIQWSPMAQPPAGLGIAAALNSAGGGARSGSGQARHGDQARASGSAAISAQPGGRGHVAGSPRASSPRASSGRAGGVAVSGRAPAAAQRRAPVRRPPAHAAAVAVPAVYRNPLRDISGLIPERIDQGVDFGGTGPIYALGNAVITAASGSNYGWPGGGWITYRLTSGPAAGLMVFVAEDVRPAVQAGQAVTSSTVIARMFNGGDGIETGWAMADGFTAESQVAAAGGISGNGPFPTQVGLNFEELLQALGVPAGNNREATPYGSLPAQYPSDWPAILYPRQ